MYTQQEQDSVREYVSTLPGNLREHAEDFVSLCMTRTEVETIVATARRTGHEWWVSAVDDHVAEQLDVSVGQMKPRRGIREGSEHVTTIRAAMSEADKNAMRVEYAGVTDLVFQPAGRGEPVDHALANAARTIASVQMRRLIPRGSRVLEVGARGEHAVIFGAPVGKYYGVMPVLGSHDVQRQSQSARNIRLMLARKGTHALKQNQRDVAMVYLDNFDAMFTRKRVQDVTWPADVILSLDSNPDIPMGDVPALMSRCGATAYMGSMPRCQAACVFTGRHKGHIRMLGFDYEIDADEDRISFNFRSTARPYKHRLSTYRDYMMYTHRVYQYKGAQYVYMILPSSVPSYLMYAFYRVPDQVYAERRFAYMPTGDGGRVRIQTVVAGTSEITSTSVSVFEVEEADFSRILQDRMLGKKDMEDGEVVRLVRGACLGMVVNGIRLRSDHVMAQSLIQPVAVAVNVLARDMFKRGDFSLRTARSVIRAGGYRYAGLWHTACDVLWGQGTVPGTFVTMVTDRMRAVTAPEVGLKLERLPAYQRFDSIVGGDNEDPVHKPSKCTCDEIREAKSVLAGDRGGLSQDEATVLTQYLRLLRDRGCKVHEFDAGRVTDGIEMCEYDGPLLQSESGGSETLGNSDSSCADEDEFVDAADYPSSEESEGDLYGGQQLVPQAEGPVRDAIEEFVDIQERQMEAMDSDAVKWAKVLTRGKVEEAVVEAASDGRSTHHFLRVTGGLVTGIIGKGEDAQGFLRAYDYHQEKFYDIRRVENSRQCVVPVRASSLLYTSSKMMIRNQPAMIAASLRVLRNPHVGPVVRKLTFVNGVFGCGKTREIKSIFRTGDVYATATRCSADTVRKDLFAGSATGVQCIRTFDSIVSHGAPVAEKLLMDEVPMVHAGQVLVVMEVTKPKQVFGFGDFFQIQYVSFLAAYRMKFSSLEKFCDIQTRMITHRCRVSICAAVLPIYGLNSGLGVCTCCEHIQESEEAIQYHRIVSVEEVPLEKNTKYIVTTQDEKTAIQSRLVAQGMSAGNVKSSSDLSMVSSVHEVQGETYDSVILLRTDKRKRPGSIFFSLPHALVAFTRARVSVRRFTVSDEQDAYYTLYQNSLNDDYRRIVRENSK